jgi:hypothetical protein
MGDNKISVWFFIGSLLVIYGVIILSASIYDLYIPITGSHIIFANLHAGIWWGALLLILGLVYTISFRPKKVK